MGDQHWALHLDSGKAFFTHNAPVTSANESINKCSVGGPRCPVTFKRAHSPVPATGCQTRRRLSLDNSRVDVFSSALGAGAERAGLAGDPQTALDSERARSAAAFLTAIIKCLRG
ncbi:hypothetical protein AAFF_G00416210 [Aldrovandia affinis]|uniref:Uncharacterized protein n=1 Tax=Aldrovandia affinis TaxID=143900 RepID=A0AAD7WK42_9TELE|nr:hypothetical protein AAFF_G00416210 [Aldrovandia affinis]